MRLYEKDKMIKKLVVTGDIAAGKSTVSRIFKEKGFQVINADDVAKDLMQRKGFVDKLRDKFSFTSTDDKFKKQFFINTELYTFVTEELYPTLYDSFVKVHAEETTIYEIPLYFESLSYALEAGFVADYIIYVTADDEIRTQRLKEFRKMKITNIREREKHFLYRGQKLAESDYIIYNNKMKEDLIKSVESLINEKAKKNH